MNRILASLYASMAFCLPAALAQVPSEPNLTEFNVVHKPGRVTRHKFTIETTGSVKLPAPMPDQTSTSVIEQEMVTKCIAVHPDGSATVELTTPRFAMKTAVGAFEMSFDSAADADNKSFPGGEFIARMVRAATQVKLTATVGPDARFTKIQGMAEAMKKTLGELDDPKGGPSAKAVMARIAPMFDDETITQMTRSFWRMIPPKRRVRIGETWTEHSEVNMPMFGGKVQTESRYEFLGVEDFQNRPCARIRIVESSRTVPSPEEKKPETPAASQSVEALLAGITSNVQSDEGEGLAYWDYRTGVLVELRLTHTMTMEISMPALLSPAADKNQPPKPPAPMIQTLTTSTTTNLLEQTDAPADSP